MQIDAGNQLGLTGAQAQTDQLSQAALSLAKKAKGDDKAAADVPRQFSKLMATMLVKEMRQALPQGFFGEGTGSDIFDGWLDEHIGSALAERDGLRLEEMIAHSLLTKAEAKARDAAQAEPAQAAPATIPTVPEQIP